MKKTVFIIFAAAAIIIFQPAVSASNYIVKLKSDIQLMSVNTDLVPLIPKLGLYTTDDPENINPELIEFTEEDAPVELFGSYDYSYAEEQSAHKITEIKSMWDIGVYGKGIRVGVIDSGCNVHEALSDNLCDGADFSGGNDVNDRIGHGTSVCGVIAAGYGFDAIGTAHKAEIIPLKFIDRDENGRTVGGTVSRLADAIISAADDFDCDIINMSCGTTDSHTLKLAVDYAESKNIIMVAAVGNSGNEKYSYPAAYNNVIGVGSVSNTKEHSSFSNINDSVFVTAPGEQVNVISDVDEYKQNSGTSFSAPYVSGIIALIREVQPDITLRETKDIISSTSEDLGDKGYDVIFGYGLVRADNIADYILSKYGYFVSGIDLCPEDNFYEIRFSLNNRIENPLCIFAEYVDGRLNQVDLDKKYVSDNVFMLRLQKTSMGIFKYFIWETFQNMKPIDHL